MASRNQIAELAAPDAGVRKDIDPRALPPNALAEGKNVLNIDGRLEPRPAHQALAVTEPWRQILGTYTTYALAVGKRYVVSGHMDSLAYSEDWKDWSWYSFSTTNKDMVCIVHDPERPYWYVFDENGVMYVSGSNATDVFPRFPDKEASDDEQFITRAAPFGGITDVSSGAINPLDHRLLVAVKNAAGNYVLCHTENPTAASPTWSAVFTAPSGSTGPLIEYCSGEWIVVDKSGSIKVATDQTGLVSGDFSENGPGGSVVFVGVDSDRRATIAAVGNDGGDLKLYGSTDTGATFSLRLTLAAETARGIAHLGGGMFLVVGDDASYLVDSSDWSHTVRETLSRASELQGLARHENGHAIAVTGSQGVWTHHPWADRPTSVVQYDADDERRAIVMGFERSIRRLDQVNDEWVDLTPGFPRLSGKAPFSSWVWRTFEVGGRTLLLGTNGTDPPMVYDVRTHAMARAMGGTPPVARTMAISANRVLLGNLRSGGTVSGQAVDVSAFNNPDAGWGTVQVSLLGDTDGEIVAMAEISSLQTAIYMTDAIYHSIAQVEFLGVAAPFRYELVASGIQGPCSPHALARVEGTQVYLAQDGGVYIHEGSGLPRDVGRHVRAITQPQFDDDQPDAAWLAYDEYHHLLWGFYPSVTGGMSQGFVLVTDRGWPWPVYEVQLPSSWEAVAGARVFMRTELTIGDLTDPIGYLDTAIGSWVDYDAEMLVALDDGSLKQQKRTDDGTYDDDGTPIDVEWRSGIHALGERQAFKTVQQTQEQFSTLQAGEEFDVTVVGVDEQGAEQTSGPVTIDSTTRYHQTGHRLTERLFAHKVTASVSRFFRWHGSDITFRYRGRR